MTGSALGQLGMVVMALIGIINVLRTRRGPKVDPDAETRAAGRLEMERRMASYLAARDDFGKEGARDDRG